MILKPFMLRRIKLDVENELSEKVEVLLYCPLTIRQKLLYVGLKKNINIDEILQRLGSQSNSSSSNFTSSLMNLVMQFRKVCNHPELFERRTARSPLSMTLGPYRVPKLVANEGHLYHPSCMKAKHHILYNKLSVFHPSHVNQSLNQTKKEERLEVSDSPFSYLRFVDTSAQEQYDAHLSLLARWMRIARQLKRLEKVFLDRQWGHEDSSSHSRLLITPVSTMSPHNVSRSPALSSLVFTGHADPSYAHVDVTLHPMRETLTHRLIRTKYEHRRRKRDEADVIEEDIDLTQCLVPSIESSNREKVPTTLSCQLTQMPGFLYDRCCPVAVPGLLPYASDRSFSYKIHDHSRCGGREGLQCVLQGSPEAAEASGRPSLGATEWACLWGSRSRHGFSNVVIPGKELFHSSFSHPV